jgi:hypothetical protein
MGGGYFVCLLHPDEAQVYCERVLQTWRTHLPALYNSVGLMKAYEDAQAGTAVGGAIPIVDLLICLTTRHANENPTAQELFEVLTQIRNSALGTAVPGLHVDRRG